MAFSARWSRKIVSLGHWWRDEGSGRVAFAPSSLHVKLAMVSLLVFTCFLVDAKVRAPGGPDLWAMKEIQRLDHPRLGPNLEIFEKLTDSEGAVLAWLVTLGVFALLRWWLPLLATFALPLGGMINETISRVLVERTRPHLAELRHVSKNFEDRSFPSGHVVGAVLLYGLIWYVVGRNIRFRPLRWMIRLAAATVIVIAGFDRVWSGAHWPSDVLGGYALGFAMVILLMIGMEWAEYEIAALRTWTGPWRWYAPGLVETSPGGLYGMVAAVRRLVARHLRPLAVRLIPPEAG